MQDGVQPKTYFCAACGSPMAVAQRRFGFSRETGAPIVMARLACQSLPEDAPSGRHDVYSAGDLRLRHMDVPEGLA